MRDNFPKTVIDQARLRSAFICSNPSCRRLTIQPSLSDESGALVLGKVSHITAAAPGGPRFNRNISAKARRSLDNAIYLCATCADLIDKNGGMGHPEALLHQWKKEHEAWVARNVNRSMDQEERPQMEPEFLFYGSQQGKASLGVLVHVIGRIAAIDVWLEARIEPPLEEHPSAGRTWWDRVAPPMVGDSEHLIPGINMTQLPRDGHLVATLRYKDADGHQWTTTFQEDLGQTINRSRTIHLLS